MASAITLGAIAAATAPAATLMVVKQYKADGPLTRLLLMVVALDDAVGLVLFSASFGIANALEQGRIGAISILVEPVVEIVFSLGLGAAAGFALNQLALTAAGEIIPEGRTNARMANKPEFPVSLD